MGMVSAYHVFAWLLFLIGVCTLVFRDRYGPYDDIVPGLMILAAAFMIWYPFM